MTHDTITFLSDYGHADEFVGVVHSVLHSLAPDVHVIDLTHDIAPFDVRGAGLLLARSAPYLSPGVVLAVVDPGVGTERRAVAIEVGGGASVLVGPDNGLLAPAVAMVGGAERAVELTNPELRLDAMGTTFDGRDVFAPAAAHLANGVPLDDLGPLIDAASLLPGTLPVAHADGDELVAEVLWVDRFGNAQLNVDVDDVAHLGAVALGDRVGIRVGQNRRTTVLVASFDAIGSGDFGLIVDSAGLLAVVAARVSAAEALGLGPGTEVVLSEVGRPAGVTTSVEFGRRAGNGDHA